MIGQQQRRYTFKVNHKGTRGLKSVAAFMNRVGNMLNNLRVVGGDAIITPDAIWIRAGGESSADTRPRSFALSKSGTHGEIASITEGRFIVHGIGTYSVAADTVTLTGGPYVWVYAHASANNWTTNGIAVASGTVDQEPRTNNAQIIVTLYEFQYVAETESYSLTNVRAGGQDVQFMAAIRGGN